MEDENNFVRIVAVADMHCGSDGGLTPPQFDAEPGDRDSAEYKAWELRRWHYGEFYDAVKLWGPFDIAVINGDTLDGDQSRSRGQDLIFADRLTQANCAIANVKVLQAKKYIFVQGTPYHDGTDEDFATLVADAFGEVSRKEQFFDVMGTVFHAKHVAGGSQNPNTRQNALGQEIAKMRTRIAERTIEPDYVHVLIRSHCHYKGQLADGRMQAIRTPALQLTNNSKYGRTFDLPQDFGFTVIDVYGEGITSIQQVVWVPSPTELMLIDQGVFEEAGEERRISAMQTLVSRCNVGQAAPTGLMERPKSKAPVRKPREAKPSGLMAPAKRPKAQK